MEQEFPPTTTIQSQLTAAQRADLLAFLKSIDGTTPHLRSEGDVFRDAVRTAGHLSDASAPADDERDAHDIRPKRVGPAVERPTPRL